MKRTIITILTISALAGCNSTPHINTHLARFQNPEISKEPFQFDLSLGTDNTVKTSMNPVKDSDIDTKIRVSGSLALGGGFELEVNEKASLRYQFSGEHREQAVAGNISQAVSIGYGKDANSNEFGYEEELNGRLYKLDVNYLDVAWNVGYRYSPEWLFYGSVFAKQGRSKISYYSAIDYSVNSSCTEKFANACLLERMTDSGKVYGITAAAEYALTSKWALEVEGVLSHVNWFDKGENVTTLNANIKYRF